MLKLFLTEFWKTSLCQNSVKNSFNIFRAFSGLLTWGVLYSLLLIHQSTKFLTNQSRDTPAFLSQRTWGTNPGCYWCSTPRLESRESSLCIRFQTQHADLLGVLTASPPLIPLERQSRPYPTKRAPQILGEIKKWAIFRAIQWKKLINTD